MLWTGIGVAFDLLRPGVLRTAIRAILIVHYVSALCLLASRHEQVLDLVRGPVLLWAVFAAWSLLYAWVQVTVWRATERPFE